MPTLDVLTVVLLTAMNLITVSVALPLLMGRGVSRAARLARHSLAAQAGGWLCVALSGFWSGHWLDPTLSTVSMFFGMLAPHCLILALDEWLGPRPARRLSWPLTLLMPLGYLLLFEHYAARVAWASWLLALQLGLVAWAALWPTRPAQANWRWLIVACHVTVALLMAARGVVGGFFPETYPAFDAPNPVNLATQIAANLALVLTTVAILVAWRDETEAQLRVLSTTDGLTGLLNHRTWHERAAVALASARRHRRPLVLLLIDLDHFKRINDQHGHEAGDAALRLFSSVLREELRAGDLAGRLGGEEFAVLLEHGSEKAAEALDRRLRQRLAAQAPTLLGFALDFSAGAARPSPADTGLRDWLARADRAMYQAKAAGRGALVEA